MIKTNKCLKVEYNNGEGATYYTYKTKSTSVFHYGKIVERKEYFEMSTYSGDLKKFYKNKNLVEYYNTVTDKVKDITSTVKYEIIKE